MTCDANGRCRTIFQSDQDKELTCARELYRQGQVEQRENCKEHSISNPDYMTGLNIKECVLDVQALYLKQLAAEENHVKGVAKILGSETIDLKENKEEVTKVIKVLQY